ncbi:ankyrin repeat domain-containing protein [Candidatus Micrarchaeota archaeon]|nr:ankyrin repeat domain-containing protein [Candidatus Micrarchaeota archaeon]
MVDWSYELFEAARIGDIKRVKEALGHGADVNVKITRAVWEDCYATHTPLQIALIHDHFKIVNLLLERGADINIEGTDAPPLHYAIPHLDIVKILLGRGAKPNAKDILGRTALHEAAENNCAEIARLLIEIGWDVDAVDEYKKWAPLHIAAEKNNVEVAIVLIDNHANLNLEDNNQLTPIAIALHKFNVKMVRVLVLAGADLQKGFKDAQYYINRYAQFPSKLSLESMLYYFLDRRAPEDVRLVPENVKILIELGLDIQKLPDYTQEKITQLLERPSEKALETAADSKIDPPRASDIVKQARAVQKAPQDKAKRNSKIKG